MKSLMVWPVRVYLFARIPPFARPELDLRNLASARKRHLQEEEEELCALWHGLSKSESPAIVEKRVLRH
jgi:hypothetical protein